MCKIHKSYLLSFLIALLFPFVNAFGQGHDLEALKKEYPLLMERYGSRLESRSAHYIFAIDISSSMKAYEKETRESLIHFVNAVPDGDQITIIVMCDENNTNYLDLAKCITLNNQLRQSIEQAIRSNAFTFLRSGDRRDGSDGFTMTRKVLDAMNVAGSSDLTFVYMLTDFEYWTHKYHYDKDKEDWASLKPMLADKHKDMLCKYGVELTLNKVKHPEAIFKSNLDSIFGSLEYQQASSAEMLSQWFGHIINDIRAHKINAMLKSDWKELIDSSKVSLQKDGEQINAIIKVPSSKLINGASVSFSDVLTNNHISSNDGIAVSLNDDSYIANVGSYSKKKTWYPSIMKSIPANTDLQVSFESPYSEEIHKLQGLCRENADSPNAIHLSQDYPVTTPPASIWNSYIPLWVCLVLLSLFVIWILCMLVTFLLNKFGKIYRTWNVIAFVDDGENQETFSHTFPKAKKVTVNPSSIGIINGDNWSFDIITDDGPIYRIWHPRGYYIKRGCNMNIEYRGKTKVLPKSEYRVTPLKKWGSGCKLKFKSNNLEYVIKIQ